MAVFTCPTCSSKLNPLVMNKAAFTNAVNFYECSNDDCDYETEIVSSLDKGN